MKLDYSLTVIDDEGNIVINHPLTADEAVVILAPHFKAPDPIEQIHEAAERLTEFHGIPVEVTDAPPKQKRIYKKRAGSPARPAKKVKGGGGGKRQLLCKNCGEPGHFAKTCPNPTASQDDRMIGSSAAAPKGREPLSKEQYNQVRQAMRLDDFMSAEFASANDMPTREVNSAIRSDNYEDYLAIR